MMAEEDMFLTQGQPDHVGDDMYTSLAAAIAVRKCKVVQKKEKIKLAVYSIKKLNKEIKLVNNETKRLNKEKDEVDHQETLRVENLKGGTESRASLETVLSDLTNKVTTEKNETVEKLKMYKSSLQNANKIWESYQTKYNEFPLAKKRREVSVELKKVNINMMSVKMSIEDLKYMEKLRIEIKDKRHRVWLINLAKAYLKIQEGMAKTDELVKSKHALNGQIEDIKAKKHSKIHEGVTEPILTSRQIKIPEVQMTQTAHFLEFKVPQFQITSPPSSGSAAVPSRYSLFNWAAFNFGKEFNLSKQTQNKNVEMMKLTSDNMLSTNTVNKPQTQTNSYSKQVSEMHKEKIHEDNRKTAQSTLSLKSMNNNLNDKVSVVHKKVEDNMSGFKRKKAIEDNSLEESKQTQIIQPFKKKPNSENVQGKKYLNLTLRSEDNNKWVPFMEKKSNENTFKTSNNDDNCKENESPSCLTRTKPAMSSFMIESKNKTTPMLKPNKSMCEKLLKSTLYAKQSGVQKQVHESQKTTPSENSLPSLNYHPDDNPNPPINYQTKHDSEKEDCLFVSDNVENQPGNVAITMDPSSPPDIVPVENNSQPLSQTHMSQVGSGKFPSQSFSDMTSPSDLDEEANLHYQRIAAEFPVFASPRGPAFKSTKSGAQTAEATVHSQYFQNLPSPESQSLNTPTTQDDYQSPSLYSPPANFHLNNDSNPPMNSVLSPPLLNSGESFEKNSSAKMSLFDKPKNMDGSKSPDGGFSFNFMSAPSQTKPSFFSLF